LFVCFPGVTTYLDRKFQIVDGSLFNPDLAAINPNLNIAAKHDVVTVSPSGRAEYFTITLNLTGTLESPVVRFTAEPALSELDILSILTFGERMGGMGGDISSRLTNIAAQQVLGIGARRLEKLLNLDRVSVTGTQSEGITIGVTKRVTNRLSLSYETSTGNITNQKAAAQYRLLSNLYLEGQTTSEGEGAVNLMFRYSR
jgi:autotransporter translocation and assembly factor TamB